MVPTTRILADRRLIISMLGMLAAANLVALALVLGPLRGRVQSLTQRATTASLGSAAAARELTLARQTASGSLKAVGDLDRFYTQILPADQPAARQMTFVRVAQLARQHGLEYDQRSFGQEAPGRTDTGVLTRATLTMSVFGSYRDLRQFIYALETGDDFIVIRDVAVVRSDEPNAPLEAALTLSTYFRGADGR